MSARELIAHSLHSSHLESSDIREMPIDRIGALARATKLGRLLWRWKYAKQECRGAVLSELLVKARKRTRIGKFHKEHSTLEKACRQGLLEWYSPQCRNCRGACEVMLGDKKMVCPQCNGVGVHAYGDRERVDGMGISQEEYDKVWERRLRDIFDIITANDASTGSEIFLQLERQTA